MILLRNQQITYASWWTILKDNPLSSPFQTPDYYELCNRLKGISAEVFALEDKNNLRALCVVTLLKESGIQGYFSRRAIIYGGPVLKDSDNDMFNLFIKSIEEHVTPNVIYIEIRNFFDYSQLNSIYKLADWELMPYLNIKLSLKGKSLEDTLSLMKYNRKREIKLSIAEGAIFREANDISEVRNLYDILRDLYINKVKLPLPNWDFFLSFFNESICKVFVVLHNNKIIGGSFCYFLEKKSIYTMYYCGIRNYHKKIFPTHLSILAAIEFGIRENLENIDFMGAGLQGKEYGVREYKREFGGELYEYGRFRKINNRFLFVLGVVGLKIQKHIKK